MLGGTPPFKRRRLEAPQDAPNALAPFVAPLPPPPLRGADFIENIQHLAKGGMLTKPVIAARVRIPYLIGPTVATAKPEVSDVSGTFSTATRYSPKVWTQGMLQPFGDTSYFDTEYTTVAQPPRNPLKPPKKPKMMKTAGAVTGRAVPMTMDMAKATVESRAMKHLASKDDTEYNIAAKAPDVHALAPTEQAAKYWGGLTMGSYLEEITASQALGIHDVGSAMRGKVMASKWRMKTQGVASEADFGRSMLKAFPQLGKKDLQDAVRLQGWPGFLSNSKGSLMGASALVEAQRGTQQKDVNDHHMGVAGSVYHAHVEAKRAAGGQFDKKFGAIKAGSLDLATAGQWWTNMGAHVTDAIKPEHALTREALRGDYVGRKLDRHGIKQMMGPTEIAKREFKQAVIGRGDDPAVMKVTDRTGYRAEKQKFVTGILTANGFDPARYASRQKSSTKFDAKLDHAVTNGSLPAGNWWRPLDIARAKTLTPVDRKALKLSYMQSRKDRGK